MQQQQQQPQQGEEEEEVVREEEGEKYNRNKINSFSECLFFLGADSGEDAWEIPRHGMPENAREYRSGVYKQICTLQVHWGAGRSTDEKFVH